MECEWLKNESNYFVTCKYFQLILQPLQTFTNVCIYRNMCIDSCIDRY